MSGASFQVRFVSASSSLTSTAISGMSGFSHIGDMTAGGGLNALFDGNTSQTLSAGSRTSSANDTAYGGQDWGSGNSKILDHVLVYRPSDGNWSGSGRAGTATVYGNNSAPSSQTDGTALGSSAYSSATASVDITGLVATTGYRYHWVRWAATSPAGGNVGCAEMQMWEWL